MRLIIFYSYVSAFGFGLFGNGLCRKLKFFAFEFLLRLRASTLNYSGLN